MNAKLYVLPASHPCAAVEAALNLKGIAFDRVDLLPMSQMLIGPLRYGGSTVPGMRIDGEKLVGSRAIMRRLDELAPDPPLLPPPGDERYARVLEAERWGDEVLQGVPRRIIDVAFLRRPHAMESYIGDARLPIPRALMRTGDAAHGQADGVQKQGEGCDRTGRHRGAARSARSCGRLDRRRADRRGQTQRS